jgi:hypothetical protein
MPGLSWTMVPSSPRPDADPPIPVPVTTGEDTSWSLGEAVLSMRTAGMSGAANVLPRVGAIQVAPARRARLTQVLARVGSSLSWRRSLAPRTEVISRWQ